MDYLELNANTHFLPKMNALVTQVKTADFLSRDAARCVWRCVCGRIWGDSDDLPL